MPYINIKMARGRTVEQKRQLVKAVTDDVVNILKVKPEWVTVIIDEYSREDWASAGELHIDRLGPGHGRQGAEDA